VATVVDLYIGYQTVNHIAYLNEITEVLDVNKIALGLATKCLDRGTLCECVPKIIINDTINLFFKLQTAFR